MRLLLLLLVIWVALQVIYKIPVFGILVRQKTYILKMRTIGFFTRLIVIFLSALNFLTRA
jgi:hypothetical protein